MHLHVRRSPNKKRHQGFRARMRTKSGRKIINARRAMRGTFP
ncbi:MAG: 50S ribosomal protein L34 [Planctomycetia bacterium]